MRPLFRYTDSRTMPLEPHPDAELVARCQKGDEGAWADLVAAYGKKVYGIAWHMTYDRAEAEELAQDCFLKVWQNLDRYEPTEASLLAWIAALSRNLCIDHYRRRKREKGFLFLSDDAVSTLLPATDDPQADAVRRERVRMLLDAISELPDELAEVVILRDLDGLDYREIGDLLKLADGTVKSRLNRARIELARVVRGRVGASTGDGRSLYSPFGPRTTTATGGAR
jgi:RNA polymerase sigma-70 factor, ECF subfamily